MGSDDQTVELEDTVEETLRNCESDNQVDPMNDFIASKGRLQREDVMEIINNMPASNVVNYMFANQAMDFETGRMNNESSEIVFDGTNANNKSQQQPPKVFFFMCTRSTTVAVAVAVAVF